MENSPLHLFLFVHGEPPPEPLFGGLVQAVHLDPAKGDQAFRDLLARKDLGTIPCLSLWRKFPHFIQDFDLFRIRAQAERLRLIQLRRQFSDFGFREKLVREYSKTRRENFEIAGRELGWPLHHAPESLADFYGLTLLREDFEALVQSENNLFDPKSWVRGAIKLRFDLQFVSRSEDPGLRPKPAL